MVDQFYGRLGHQDSAIRLGGTEHGPQERCEDLFAPSGDAPCDSLGDSRMPSQKLMSALVSQDCCEGEILRVGIALERLGMDGQQVLFRRAAPAVLRAARLAVDVAVL